MFACCAGGETKNQPELLYFDLPGRGEAIRLAYLLGGKKFVDNRIQPDDWPLVQPRTPMGRVPVLNLPTTKVSQSVAILMYVGTEAKLVPTDSVGYCQVMDVLDIIEDVFVVITAYQRGLEPGMEASPEAKKEMCEKFVLHCERVNHKLRDVAPGGYCWGKTLTVADLQVYVLASMVKNGGVMDCPANALDEFKKILDVHETVGKHPKIIEYYKPKAAA